jgi:nitrate/TMAO reductase-like tetraheme cytochrome c subunit
MKKLLEIIKDQWKVIVVTAALTTFVIFFVWGGEKIFSSTTFCLSCHSMSYVNAELKDSGHYDTGIGPNPECQDCHLPPQFLLRVESHVVDGIRAVIGEFKHDLSTKEGFDEYRLEYAHNARMNLKKWNSSPCTVMCHRNPQPPGEAEEAHKKMETEGATCIDCHQNLVHDEVEEEDLDEGLRLGKIVLKEEEDEEEDEDEE